MLRLVPSLAFASIFMLSSVVGSPIHAQASNPLVGKWSIEYERGRRMENGESTPIMGSGTMTIVQEGDSLVATFEAGPRPDGSPSPATRAAARPTAEGVIFLQEQTARINANGEVSEVKVKLTWTLSASGDAISGTLARDLPMIPEPLPPTPVKGTRVKG